MNRIGVLVLCCALAGCVTVNSVKRDLQHVDYHDGVNEKEAVAIARMSMIQSKLHHDYHLWAATIDDFVGYWKVVFLSLYLNRHACVLIIEKDSGDILAFFEAVDDKEAALGANPQYSVEEWRRLRKFD